MAPIHRIAPPRIATATAWALIASMVLGASGCVGARGARSMLVSSETSAYSPVVSLLAKNRVADSMRIEVSRGSVLAPGDVFAGMPAITGGLSVRATC